MTAVALTDTTPRIAYDDRGNGEPALLLLTGWCSSRQRWADVAPLLARHHRVVSFEWRGHGDSDPAADDFGNDELVKDALAVVDAARLSSFVPCAASHAGWIAIELRRRLPDRVPALVHLDWMVIEPQERYMHVIEQLTSPEEWPHARDTLFDIWRAGVNMAPVDRAFDVMAAQGGDMWMRSGCEIWSAYRQNGSPLAAWEALIPPPPVLHAYGQPTGPEYLAAQEHFAAQHLWFHVSHLPAVSHFAMLEAPGAVDAAISEFLSEHDRTSLKQF